MEDIPFHFPQWIFPQEFVDYEHKSEFVGSISETVM